MAKFLQIALWNANGLAHHADELQTFLAIRNIDIMLLSETHFTQKSYLKLSHYTIYHTNHPAGTARGGAAIIIKTPLSTILYTTTAAITFKPLVCQWKVRMMGGGLPAWFAGSCSVSSVPVVFSPLLSSVSI
jgi:exonuclease III